MNERKSPGLATTQLSRREFFTQAMLGASVAALANAAPGAAPNGPAQPPLVVFSKVYQELGLGFEAAADVTAEAGLAGVDSPVRPAGEILPERAAEDLPRFVSVLRQRGLQLPLLTTAITSVSSPQTESILRAARQWGVQYYRLGFIGRRKDVSAADQVREVRAQLKELAALNRRVGLGALLQNHSPSGHTYFGGDLSELTATVEGFDPSEIGVAFDIGHALIVHGDEWRRHFDRLRSHFRVAYIKDVKLPNRWVPFGQGDLGASGYFKMLKAMQSHAPLCLHIEFDWTNHGREKTRAALVATLRACARQVRDWLAA